MTKEHRLMNEIRLWCGQHDWLCFRCNVGTHLLADGTYFNTGLPVGFPDLMALSNDGRVVFCECKVKPNKASVEQLEFIKTVKDRSFRAGVCYSVEDFISLTNE